MDAAKPRRSRRKTQARSKPHRAPSPKTCTIKLSGPFGAWMIDAAERFKATQADVFREGMRLVAERHRLPRPPLR
jgi:hypothetical protein